MSLPGNVQHGVREQGILLALVFACLAGCADPKSTKPQAQPVNRAAETKQPRADVPSANDFLYPGDFERFRPGRSKDDILKDVKFRGKFLLGCEHQGKSAYAISYGLLAANYSPGMERDPEAEKESVYAVFVADKFTKFVDATSLGPEPDDAGPIKVGDNRWLVKAIEGAGIDIVALQRQANASPAAPKQVDPGLTVAWLLLRSRIPVASEDDYKRNAALRDQFNASRINIGMTESQVETIFKAKPLESGAVKAGSYKIYGSNEAFNITYLTLHFSNVLVLFHEGKVRFVETASPGENWRAELSQMYSDLPAPPGGKPQRAQIKKK